ncbi:hypothetical protein [Caulobacter sp. BK020]|uniref:hypothetical protein n=1 Tax=Caulobacter sp. BK020 TaxID=2512117 RepID=UPI001046CF00|nr:hypothetical protein [Caulobacter sp. BK020]TCS14552.1 hypothetical protein EV278_107201 [Caulobacter sp. BK020]
MSFLRPPKQPAPVATPDPADTANRIDDARRRRLLGGGRNGTVLGQMVEGAAASRSSPNTLTGLNGG